ncbi:MAG: S9 family peptidase [Acidobacteria bacterium]|nr:S9 family peptidase [Acidobacteriota bacterium]MBV9146140.1 S9 family peptidase [Acidobacteriota bacterium]
MINRLLVVLLLTASCFSQVSQAGSSGKRPFTFEDMMALKRIGDPQVSPDGRWVMFSAIDVNLQENTRKSHLWIVPAAGGESRQVTNGQAGESRGRFSPDGKSILYTSSATAGSQIWVTGFDTETGTPSGNARQITSLSTEADGGLWAGDGKHVVFVSEVYPECKDDACNKARDDELANSKVKAKVFTHLFYRHWSSYTRFKRSHLFVVGPDGGTPVDITPGDHDVPPFNLGGQDLYAISPDGQEIAFTSNIDEVEATSTNNDVFVVPITGGTPRKISSSPGSDSTPLYSPDGRYIAYRSQARAGYESDRFRLFLFDRKSGETSDLTQNFDRWVDAFAWAPDSTAIYFAAEDHGAAPLWRVRVSGGAPEQVLGGFNDEPTFAPDGKTIFFSRMSIQAPTEIYRASLERAGSDRGEQLSHLNDAVLSQIDMAPLESFEFTGANKAKVQGFLLKPPSFNSNQKFPVKFLIHGGPQGAWGDSWTYRWNAELFASNGYVVVMINPRGSTGYGQKFIDEINGDWGGKPYVDLMRGLDYVEKTYPFIDKERECALGASYGGYMIDWLLGHTNRFKCLVSHDGMFNAVSSFGTTEELWFNLWEFKGTPWTNPKTYKEWSPNQFAPKFQTPTLVVHSQLDYRLDVSEGFQLFTTLQLLKVPSRMLYFPDEGHWILKPQNSRLWYKTVNEWVDQWLKAETTKTAADGKSQ